MNFNACIDLYNHTRIENSYSTLKNFLKSSFYIHILPHFLSPGKLDLLSITVFFLFKECLLNGFMQYVIF